MAVDRRATRLGMLGLVGVILFSLLGIRLWFLQTVKADELRDRVTAASTRTVRLAPERGRIFDSEGRILADNRRVLTVAIDWQMLRSKTQRTDLFERLSGWVGVPVEELEDRFDPRGIANNPFLPFAVKRGIDEPTAAAIMERSEDFPGVSIISDWERVYPYAPHAAHVVGYMGAISPEQYKSFMEAGYLGDERVGQFGVERTFEELLHGDWGYRIYEVDAANRPVRLLEEVEPINGFDIQLTIDLELQQYVEQMLETTLKARQAVQVRNPEVLNKDTGRIERLDPTLGPLVNHKAPAGSAVVMNYETGQISAIASYPTFDNRWFEAGLSQTKFEQLFPVTDDPDLSILVNRAIQGRYNLGSTFKPFTAFAALNTGLLGVDEVHSDNGTYQLSEGAMDAAKCASGFFKCIFKNATCMNGLPCVYGDVTVEDALAVSSDTFFYRIGDEIFMQNNGLPILQRELRQFSFGDRTGIELPFEFRGTVPDAELKRYYAEQRVISAMEGQDYYVGDNVQLSIGQGLLSATPIQLANSYATIASGGLVLQPTILLAVYQPGVPDSVTPGYADLDAAVRYTSDGYGEAGEPRVVRDLDLEPEFRSAIVKGLRRVVLRGGGVQIPGAYRSTTGEELFYTYPSDAIQIAGKTGTAQGAHNYPWNDSSAFAGFAIDPDTEDLGPDWDSPYVVAAYLEKAGYGSQGAAPMVKCTFMALSGSIVLDPVQPSPQLDLNATTAAPSMDRASEPNFTDCWIGLYGEDMVRTTSAVAE
ncbi:MAG TPA: penicillin-binding transpeptidase domain-containing protein [Ilumatobacter sp.]|nr:penicillin-binding transpeptidase domain-containing protein [Ilumatobacter sp.]